MTSESDRTALEPVPQSVLVLQPAIRSRSRNPQSAIHSQPLSHSWGPGKKTVFPRAAISSLSARLGASLLTVHGPPARVSVGHVLSFARSYPPTLPKQASIPSFHPPPIHPSIPSRPRLPPEALFSRRRHFAANTTACVRLTTTSRQDDKTNDSHSHRAPHRRRLRRIARLNRPRRRERFTWLRPTTARPTWNSGRHIGPRHRRRQPRRRQRQRWSDASLHLPASTGITTGACRWLDRCAQWSPLASSTSPLGSDAPP